MSKFGQELIRSAHEALAIAKGEMQPAHVYIPPGGEIAPHVKPPMRKWAKRRKDRKAGKGEP